MEATKKSYPTDITDSQWELVKDLIPAAGKDWFSRFRRLNREYELLPKTSEAFFYVGMIHILLKRLV